MTIRLSDLGLTPALKKQRTKEDKKPESAIWKSSIYAKVVT